MKNRRTFLVGRMTPGCTEVFLAESARAPAPFPGPWTLKGLVHLSVAADFHRSELLSATVH